MVLIKLFQKLGTKQSIIRPVLVYIKDRYVFVGYANLTLYAGSSWSFPM